MTNLRSYMRSFSGGELSPEMIGHLEAVQVQTGCELMRNMIAKPQGPAFSRPGWRFVKEVKDSTKATYIRPFKFSIDEQLGIELGAGHFRFFQNGAYLVSSAPDLVGTKTLTAIDHTQETFDTTVAHTFNTGDPLRFDRQTAATLPTGIVLYTTYYAIVVDPNTFRVATTRSNALAGIVHTFSDNGSGTLFVHRMYVVGDTVSFGFGGQQYYCHTDSPVGATPLVVAPAVGTHAAATNLVTSVLHGLFDGTAIIFALNGGTLPPEIVPGVRYYAKPTTSDTFEVSATYGGATIDLTVDSTGSPTWQRALNWHTMGADGTFELPNPYGEGDLQDLQYFQSNDVITLLSRNHPAAELRRLDTTRWVYQPIVFGTAAQTPTNQFVNENRGQGIRLRALTAATTTVITSGNAALGTDAEHGLVVGDILYLNLEVGDDFGDLSTGFVTVNTVVDPIRFTVKTLETGERIGSGTTTVAGVPRMYKVVFGTEETQTYVITSIGLDGGESQPSAQVTATNNLSASGAFNDIGWSASPDVLRYRVYRLFNGVFGLIATVNAPSFTAADVASGVTPPFVQHIDRDEQTPDLSVTPPIFDPELGVTTGYPAAGCYFEARRFFGGTHNHRQRGYGTVSNTESDLSYHFPVLETDRLSFDVAAREQNSIRHMVPMAQLIVLTNGAEFRISPVNSDALAPGSIASRAQTYVGSSTIRPQVVNNSLLFEADRGGHIFEFGFSSEGGSFQAGDVSLRAAHLFDRFEMRDSAFGRAPIPVAWWVSNSGDLLGFTYVPEERIGAWHMHNTGTRQTDPTSLDGVVESCCTIAEGNEDILYVLVRRTINGVMRRYVERMDPMQRPAVFADHFHVDSGITVTTPGSTIAVPHLEGKTVVALVDGVLQSPKVVTGGVIAASPAVVAKAQVGLPIVCKLKPLPQAIPTDDFGRSRTKNPTHAYVDVFESCQFTAGPTESRQNPAVQLSKTATSTRRVRVPLPAGATDDGQVLIVMTDPLPLTVVGLGLETAVGG